MWTWLASMKEPDNLTEPRCLLYQRFAESTIFRSLALHPVEFCSKMRRTGQPLTSNTSQQRLH